MESVAILNIIREPPQGIFGTVTVQYIVREINSSEASVDLTPSQGYIVLEEGIRVKVICNKEFLQNVKKNIIILF